MLSIALPPEIETRLKGEASRQGLRAEDYAQKLIIEHLPSANGLGSLADLFAEWQSQDDTNDPAEIAKRNKEVEDFKQALNRNRIDMEGSRSRRLLP